MAAIHVTSAQLHSLCKSGKTRLKYSLLTLFFFPVASRRFKLLTARHQELANSRGTSPRRGINGGNWKSVRRPNFSNQPSDPTKHRRPGPGILLRSTDGANFITFSASPFGWFPFAHTTFPTTAQAESIKDRSSVFCFLTSLNASV